MDHYENFPVASLLCPPDIRPAVQAIYRFARTADDLADEGEVAPEQRRAALRRLRAALHLAAAGDDAEGAWPQVFVPLRVQMARHRLPLAPFDDLLDAFEQDVGNPRYASRAQLLEYCRRSANPVGRLVLHLAGVTDAAALRQSDAVCSALQLINFWQDLGRDLARGRCYVPAEDAQRHGLDWSDLRPGADSDASRALLRALCGWAADTMRSGAALARQVPGRLGWELRLVVAGGLRVLEKISAGGYRTLSHRPTLGPADAPRLAWRALRMRDDEPMPGFRLA